MALPRQFQNLLPFIAKEDFVENDIKDEKKGIRSIEYGVISDMEEYQQSSGDQAALAVLEEQGTAQQKRIPWAFRMNDILVRWYEIQIDRVRTSPPSYGDESSDSPEEEAFPEERSLFRTICQVFVCILCVVVAILWTYHYILGQSRKTSFSPVLAAELILLSLYLAMVGFFVCLFALRAALPLMVRLGDYATHDAGRIGRVFAIIGVLGIWSCCVVWVFALPLIPGIGGVLARRNAG